jgi:hypothetical protein
LLVSQFYENYVAKEEFLLLKHQEEIGEDSLLFPFLPLPILKNILISKQARQFFQ